LSGLILDFRALLSSNIVTAAERPSIMADHNRIEIRQLRNGIAHFAVVGSAPEIHNHR